METVGYDSRIRVLLILVGVALFMLAARLWELQLTQWGKYALEAAQNRTKIVWEPAPRGLIVDRNGEVLAHNRPQWDVKVVPAEYPKDDPAASERVVRTLAHILNAPVPQVRAALAKAVAEPALESVPLEGLGADVSLDTVARIEARRLQLPGIRVGSAVRRLYPQGRLAAHLLGYVRAINSAQYDELKEVTYPSTDPTQTPPPPIADQVYALDSMVGQCGVEQFLENTTDASGRILPLLQGRRGYRLYQVNRRMQPTWMISERPPAPGATVWLTIDSQVQRVAEEALEEATRGKAGAAVVLDVRTGEVLAMASRPTYDPNKWVKGFSPQEWEALQKDPRNPLLNQVIAGCYPPGSIFKLISSCAAFGTTDLTLTDAYYCAGVIHEGRDRRPFRCWRKHGGVAYYQGLAESCDVYFYNLVRVKGLGSDALADYARRFGLGSVTGIGLTGERAGFVPDRRWKQAQKQEPWFTGDTLNFVIGQGYLTVTPLQMAVVTAAVANGGILLQPRLVRKISWPEWTGYGTQVITQTRSRPVGVDDKILGYVRRGMRLAVEGEHGTAATLRGLGVSVAGKTGSAEHQPGRPTHAWFVCYAPADDPRYAVCVFIAEGGHGGTAAAPVARRILAAALGLTPAGSAPAPTESD